MYSPDVVGDLAQLLYQDLSASSDPLPKRTPLDRAVQRASSICSELEVEGISAATIVTYLEHLGAVRRDRRELVIESYDFSV